MEFADKGVDMSKITIRCVNGEALSFPNICSLAPRKQLSCTAATMSLLKQTEADSLPMLDLGPFNLTCQVHG